MSKPIDCNDTAFTVIFDLDGTLIDSSLDITHSINEILIAYGLQSLGHEQVLGMLGKHPKEIFRIAHAAEHALESMVLEFRDSLAKSGYPNTRIFPNVLEVLTKLNQSHIPMCIATTKPTSLAVDVCTTLQIDGFFEVIAGSEGIPHKPNPAVILKCLDNYPNHAAFYVGDTEDDIIAAHGAGIKSIAVAHGSRSIEKLRESKPTYLVSGFSDIARIFGIE